MAPLFFVHIMKTAGTSLFFSMRKSVGVENIYPRPASSEVAYFDIESLRACDRRKLSEARLIAGHFPYFVIHEMPVPVDVATVLRDPVERTISLLKQHRRAHGDPGQSLEDIYEEPEVFSLLIHNHMSKIFSLRAADGVANYLAPLEVDAGRLAAAKDNLREVRHIGLNTELNDFYGRLCACYGWSAKLPALRVSAKDAPINDAFRRRIEEDNAQDMAFYAFARELLAERA